MSIFKNALWVCCLGGPWFFSGAQLRAATIFIQMREIDVVTNVLFVFSPTNVTISPGDTVTWTNTVSHPHDTTHYPSSGPRLWASPSLSTILAAKSYSYTFNNPGVYQFVCQT